ncbi:MAG: helicase associated domain-containing protein [Paraclostridium sp.]
MHLTNDELWNNKFDKLKDYCDTKNMLPSYKTKLGIWCVTQRQSYKNGKLSKEREVRLSNLSVWRW